MAKARARAAPKPDNYRSASAAIVNWPKAYLQAIRSGHEVVSELVRMVYERECGWMDAPPVNDPEWHYRFDEAKGQRCITFIERFCRQSKGRQMGKPIRLELFQKAKLQLVLAGCISRRASAASVRWWISVGESAESPQRRRRWSCSA